jgi:hypothetical protein
MMGFLPCAWCRSTVVTIAVLQTLVAVLPQMVQLLVDAGADLEATLQPVSDSSNLLAAVSRATTLALAAAEGKLDVIQVLLGEWQQLT